MPGVFDDLFVVVATPASRSAEQAATSRFLMRKASTRVAVQSRLSERVRESETDSTIPIGLSDKRAEQRRYQFPLGRDSRQELPAEDADDLWLSFVPTRVGVGKPQLGPEVEENNTRKRKRKKKPKKSRKGRKR